MVYFVSERKTKNLSVNDYANVTIYENQLGYVWVLEDAMNENAKQVQTLAGGCHRS